MGSCISKCRPKNSNNSENPEEEKQEKFNNVQDKLVIISQTPPSTILQNSTPLYKIPNKILPSPPSPSASTSSSSSVSSFTTCPYSTKTTSSISSSSTSSSSSTVSSLKYIRSFSNDYLWSCYKENPHIIRINSIKQSSNNNNFTTSVSSFPQKVPISNVVTSQKRVRSSSPSSTSDHLTRKSFRRDIQPEKLNLNLNSRPSRRLTSRSPSPSPSRRFVTNGDNYKCTSQYSKRKAPNYSLGSSRRVNAFGNYSDPTTTSYYSRKENIRPTSPSRNDIASRDRMIRPSLRTRGQPLNNNNNNNIHRIGSKIDESAVGEAMITDHEMDSVLMEDIDNPLISLDCFIFL